MKKIIFIIFCILNVCSKCFTWTDMPYICECSERGIKQNPYICALKLIEGIHHHLEIKNCDYRPYLINNLIGRLEKIRQNYIDRVIETTDEDNQYD